MPIFTPYEKHYGNPPTLGNHTFKCLISERTDSPRFHKREKFVGGLRFRFSNSRPADFSAFYGRGMEQ